MAEPQNDPIPRTSSLTLVPLPPLDKSKEKEDKRREKEVEKALKKEEKLTKERIKLVQGLGLPESEEILDDFACAIKRPILLQGRMYVTQNYVCFKVSLGSTQEVFAFKDVTEIRKDVTYFVPNAIVIKTADKEMFLGSFIYREKAFQVLSEIWSAARADKPMDLEALRRAVQLARKGAERTRSRDDTVSSSSTQGGTSLDADACANIDLGPDDELTQRLFAAPEPGAPQLPALLQPSNKRAPVVNSVYPVPLKTFFRLFLADQSTFSQEIHTFQQDINIKVMPWGPDPVVRGLFCRMLTFQTPVKSRLAKRSLVDVQQTQRCQLHTPTELWIATSNAISGVPYSDEFTVESKWRLSAETETSTRLEIWVEMAWGPHPPMEITRLMIEKSSLGGASLMFENYAKLARAKLQRIANPRAPVGATLGEEEGKPADPQPEEVLRKPSDMSEVPSVERVTTVSRMRLVLLVWTVLVFLLMVYLQLRLNTLARRLALVQFPVTV